MFEGQPSKTRPFFNQNKGHLGSTYMEFQKAKGDEFQMFRDIYLRYLVTILMFGMYVY